MNIYISALLPLTPPYKSPFPFSFLHFACHHLVKAQRQHVLPGLGQPTQITRVQKRVHLSSSSSSRWPLATLKNP